VGIITENRISTLSLFLVREFPKRGILAPFSLEVSNNVDVCSEHAHGLRYMKNVACEGDRQLPPGRIEARRLGNHTGEVAAGMAVVRAQGDECGGATGAMLAAIS
jgi:hypothetical protein